MFYPLSPVVFGDDGLLAGAKADDVFVHMETVQVLSGTSFFTVTLCGAHYSLSLSLSLLLPFASVRRREELHTVLLGASNGCVGRFPLTLLAVAR